MSERDLYQKNYAHILGCVATGILSRGAGSLLSRESKIKMVKTIIELSDDLIEEVEKTMDAWDEVDEQKKENFFENNI